MEDTEGNASSLAGSSTAVAEESPTAQSPSKRPRRSRVSLACQRCKHRKQKCNGGQPSCGRCLKLNLSCHYVMPSYTKPVQVKIYMKALEDRVAELETLLKNEGDRNVSRDHWALSEGLDEDTDGPQVLVNAVRDLSYDVAGSYVGGTSTITLGRALGKALAMGQQLSIPAASPEDHSMRHSGSVEGYPAYLAASGFSLLVQMPQSTADSLVDAYLKHMSTNFPIMISTEILDLHKRRLELENPFEESTLHLIYGLGVHFLQKTSEAKLYYNPEQFYLAALEERDTILRLGDTRALTYLMLLGQHCFRMPKEPGAWTFFGLAMKLCIELGLHRQKRSSKVCLQSERHKRLFWICYWHERELAIAMGRPPAICDRDIDVELPLDVDEAIQDPEILKKAKEQDRSVPAFPPTNLSTLIHLIRLKRIESAIQHTIYRVDRLMPPQELFEHTNRFLEKLQNWKDCIPSYMHSQENADNQIYLGYDSYMASYYKTLRILLQPRVYEKGTPTRYLQLCAEACRGLCLTLIYCMWIDTSNTHPISNLAALNDCSIMLYVMAERWSAGQRYRDLFELVKQSVLETMEKGHHVPRAAVTSMKDSMQIPLQQLQVDANIGNVADDLGQIIGDLTGGGDGLGWEEVVDGFWNMDPSSNMFAYLNE
ncbi:hypothetical protein CC79DRAFT_1364368 [Sarocladium strictum]